MYHSICHLCYNELSHVSLTSLTNATIMAPRRGRVASPDDEAVSPTQQPDNGAYSQDEDDGGEPLTEAGVDEDAAGSDEDAPSRKRTRLSDEGAAADVEPKNEPMREMTPRVTLPRDPADG
jgi:hypothetical protein